MSQTEMIATLTEAARPLSHLQGLYLVGSFGRGSQDAFSDIDMLAVVPREHHVAFAQDWQRLLQDHWQIVFMQRRDFRSILMNAITVDWIRCDLIIDAEEGLLRRAKAVVRPLIENEQLYCKLSDELPTAQISASRVVEIANEFIRVLGLLAVVVGREEYFTGAAGAGMLRDLFAKLLTEMSALADPGGALHQSRTLAADKMKILNELPVATIDRASIIEAHIRTARAFFPIARRAVTQVGAIWPSQFENATRHFLQRELGREFDVSWSLAAV